MSITVRYWTKDELNYLASIQSQKQFDHASNDYKQLLTKFINKTSYSEYEMEVYRGIPVTLKNNYVVSLEDADMVEFKAPNDDMAKWFISQEYIVDMATIQIHEVTTHYRKI